MMHTNQAPLSEDLDPELIELLEELSARAQEGQTIDMDRVLEANPRHAERLRPLLPAICGLVALRQSETTDRTAFHGMAEAVGGNWVFGDFLILRRIGQGGMGVVYEALQRSLGRHVALKILSAAGLTPMLRERFQREAQAAARLHHGNIVPVFGVGQESGVHYYAMQYIAGSSLDSVLRQVKRLRENDLDKSVAPEEQLSLALALGLRCGDFRSGLHDTETTSRAATPAATPAAMPAPTPGEHAPPLREGATSEDRSYFRGVAKIGEQVASALAYANEQGVLHRDVKPSNLLIDAVGSVWVTDFGLARIEGAGELTQTGDVLGTPRYMAPERLRGLGDARSDVYSLGLTLYEMLTLRPAFEDSDRVRLTGRIAKENPPPPRQLDRRVPRDLETIVLKAIDKEPNGRYASARDFADDLQRFLNEQPIQARPVRAWERLAKWARRRPTAAALVLTVLAAVSALVGILVWSNLQIGGALLESQNANVDAEKARDEAITALAKADKARDEARRDRDAVLAETYRALLSETTLLRLTRQPGWRTRAMTNLAHLAKMKTPHRDDAALRSEAVASLEEVDVAEVAHFGDPKSPAFDLDFSSDGKRLALATARGFVSLWDVPAARESAKIVDPSFKPGAPIGRLRPMARLRPGSTELAYLGWVANVHFADAAVAAPAIHVVPGLGVARGIGFDKSGNLLAASWSDGRAVVYNIANKGTGAILEMPPDKSVSMVALSGSGNLLATGHLGAIRVQRLAPRRTVGQQVGIGVVTGLAFSPDERFLAVATADNAAHVLRIGEAAVTLRPFAYLQGHKGIVTGIAFSPDGRMVATASFDGTVRLWDAGSGATLMVLRPEIGPLNAIAFSPDGQYLATAGAKTKLYRLAHAPASRKISAPEFKGAESLAIDPRGPRLLTTQRGDRAKVWDIATGSVLTRWNGAPADPPGTTYSGAVYSPDGAWLAASARFPGKKLGVVHVWDAANGVVVRTLDGQVVRSERCFDAAAKRIASVGDDGSASVWEMSTGNLIRRWMPAKPAFEVALLSADRLLVADISGRFTLHEISTGKVRFKGAVDTRPVRFAVPSDEAFAIVIGNDLNLHVLALPDLKAHAKILSPHAGFFRAIAINDDTTLLVTGGNDGRILLYETKNWTKVLAIDVAEQAIHELAFLPNGTLAACGAFDHIALYDVRQLREQLARMGLEWPPVLVEK